MDTKAIYGISYPPVPTSQQDRECAPDNPGIYFAWDSEGHLAYVGQAIDLQQRINSSHRKLEKTDKFSWIVCHNYSHLDYTEAYYIGKYRPHRNCSKTSHSKTIRDAVADAKLRGVKLGRPSVVSDSIRTSIESRGWKMPLRKLAAELGISEGTVRKVKLSIQSDAQSADR